MLSCIFSSHQTGTLTEDGLDLWGIQRAEGGGYEKSRHVELLHTHLLCLESGFGFLYTHQRLVQFVLIKKILRLKNIAVEGFLHLPPFLTGGIHCVIHCVAR